MDRAFAENFAQEWIEAWNAHELNRVLAHYTEDFEMSSPFIAQIAGEPSGTLKGKAAVGAYWKQALERLPELHFELVSVLTGVDSVVIYYKSAGGRLAAELFFFSPAGKVSKAAAHYAAEVRPQASIQGKA